jgi:hypothetical protein
MPNAPEMAWRLNCVGNMLSIGSAYRAERIEGDDLVSDTTLTPVIQGMLDRGLLELRDDGGHWLRARFTEVGLSALRHMAEDARALPPGEYQHVLDELGSGQRAEVEHG